MVRKFNTHVLGVYMVTNYYQYIHKLQKNGAAFSQQKDLRCNNDNSFNKDFQVSNNITSIHLFNLCNSVIFYYIIRV